MGSDETATATTGGPQVIDVFSGDGCHRVQIIYCFRMQIGARTRSGIDLGSGGPLDRMRRCSGLSRELWIENFGGSWYRSAHFFFFSVLDLTVENNPRSPGVATTAVNKYLLRR